MFKFFTNLVTLVAIFKILSLSLAIIVVYYIVMFFPVSTE